MDAITGWTLEAGIANLQATLLLVEPSLSQRAIMDHEFCPPNAKAPSAIYAFKRVLRKDV